MRSLILILCGLCGSSAAIELPDIGASAGTIMSPQQEQKLGEAFIRQLRQHVEIIDDIQVNDYLNALGRRLASYSNNPKPSFRFLPIKEPSINAFAVPGGFIGIHSGLILKTRTESELASVLAHEIAHVTQHHIARSVETSQLLSLPTIATIIAAIVAGAKNPQFGEAAVAAIMAGNIQMQINFTRTHEKEADRVGMQILAEAGFDPNDMPNFFERLQAASRYYSNVPEFLRTHPVTTDRIAEARDRAEKVPKTQLSDTPLYHLMKAKLLVLTDEEPPRLLKKLQKMLEEGYYHDERATRYALALTLLATRQTKGVQTQIDWLLKNDGDRVIYHLLNAQRVSLQGNPTQALQLYEQALQIYPGDYLLSLDYAEKLLQNKSATKAKTVLLALSPDESNPDYYRLLAQAHQMTGAKTEAHLALAENYYLIGKTKLAIEQLKQALRQNDLNFYLASRIEARLNELREVLREERASQPNGQ